MTNSTQTDFNDYAKEWAFRARDAARMLAVARGEQKNAWLERSAELLRNHVSSLLNANEKDVEAASGLGLTKAQIDRLRLDEDRIEGIASAMEEIAKLADPIGEIFESNVRPNGLLVTRVRVPLGVVFFIFESRPNVTADAAAICVKSGNAVILRGGKEAFHSNHAIHSLLVEALEEVGLPKDAVQLVDTIDREAVGAFLRLRDMIDVTIPRGGKGLIERVASEAAMPVIKHYDGNCHVYVDASADPEMARNITFNSKVHRPGVCNAAESLLIHRDIAAELLPSIAESLKAAGVELRCCPKSRELIPESTAATNEDFHTEFLDLIMSVKVVDDVEQAISHINEYGSHHTDVIVTRDLQAAARFSASVDSAAVHVNASTRFNDGGEYGLGAEIGISTDKFHARGPCGLRELTSYKYVVHGNGQVR
ncbi:MAG: glutamate-5-semialdehyde dehydrogenase [Planctomycetota bacterium]|nr:glutamate-5-semialdehyde dehydrogenase [Planctomycetota bacterium]